MDRAIDLVLAEQAGELAQLGHERERAHPVELGLQRVDQLEQEARDVPDRVGDVAQHDQARLALEQKNYENSYTLISKVQKIVLELTSTLKHDVSPDLCSKLAGLYSFVYRRLVDANIQHEVQALDEAMQVLKYQRETWALLMQQLQKQKAGNAATKLDMPAPNARMEASICMQG